MTEKTQEKPTSPRWKKFAIGLLAGLYLLAGLVVLGLYSLQQAYADRIYPGVTLAGVDFSGKNWDTAAQEVERILTSIEQTTIPIEVEGGEAFQPTLTQLGMEIDQDSVLAEVFSIGHGASLLSGVVTAVKSLAGGQAVGLHATFNQTMLEQYIDETTASLAKKAKNAALKVINGVVEIDPSQIGEEADPEYLKQEILGRLQTIQVAGGAVSLPRISLAISRATPDITDAEVTGIQLEAQAMIGEPITIEFEGKTYTLTQADIGSWLTFAEVGTQGEKSYHPEFDDKKITSSIASKIARNVDIKMVPKKILITTGQVIEEGGDGRSLDRARLLTDIKGLLKSRTRQAIALAVTAVPKTEQQLYPDFTLGLYEGKYIEINLAKQMLYAIEGDTLVGSYLISSGKTWGGYATPAGTRYIMNKIGMAYSRQYALWMPYWNGLAKNPDGSGYEGYGIHELPCFNRSCTRREGINHLGTPVSHGCIRLGHNGPAAFIFDWAPIGTPVYIHN